MIKFFIRGVVLLLLMPGVIRAQQPFEEFNQSESLKSLTLYAFSRGDKAELRYVNPPVASLENTAQQIVLEFDDLKARFSQYKVRIIHCEAGWTRSGLLDM
ncbi:MAG: DUF5103 domain-containing protein, partial [Leadbetterella sp.]|nr:DUF5103 domain-containing protein [Leadbetterella sp.]